MPYLHSVNAFLMDKRRWVNTMHAASVALGGAAIVGTVVRWVPGPVGAYAGLAVAGTSLLRIYVDNVEHDLETPVKVS